MGGLLTERKVWGGTVSFYPNKKGYLVYRINRNAVFIELGADKEYRIAGFSLNANANWTSCPHHITRT